MAERHFIPDPASLKDLGEMLQWWKSFKKDKQGPTRSTPPPPEGDRVWGYVVLTPPAGIPALDVTAGTDTGTGTGDEAGWQSCQVWKRDPDSDIHGGLMYAGFDVEVYNIGSVAIPGSIYVHVTRDAFGDWYADVAVGTAGAGGTGEPADACGQRITQGAASIQGYVGSAVQVLGHDADGCWIFLDTSEECA